MKDITQIDIQTELGKYLLSAIAKITTESQTDKTPDEVLAQLSELKEKIFTNAETYGSKGSDELGQSLEWNGEVTQGSNGNFKQFSLYEHKETIATANTPTSSQTEISAVKYLSDAILSQKYNNDIFDLHNIIQNAFLIEKELINKQTEISDEEIDQYAHEYNIRVIGDGWDEPFAEGMKKYREQLKKKQ